MFTKLKKKKHSSSQDHFKENKICINFYFTIYMQIYVQGIVLCYYITLF